MEILVKGLISGLITMVILLIAKITGPKLAGAIGGLPIIFAISYGIIINMNKASSNDFLIGGIYGAIAAIFFSIILIYLNKEFINTYWLNFGIAYSLCFLLCLGMTLLIPNK